jgi:hypothetical protein
MESRRTVGDFRQKLAQLFEDPDAVPLEEMKQWRPAIQLTASRGIPDDSDVGCLERTAIEDIEPMCLEFKRPRVRRESGWNFLRRWRDKDGQKRQNC